MAAVRVLAPLSIPLLVACTGTVDTPPRDDPRLVACVVDADCDTGYCVTIGDAAACVAGCADQDDCDSSATCGLTRTTDGAPATACIPPSGGESVGVVCSDASDCETGVCADSLCAEICTDCESGQSCDPVTVQLGADSVDLAVCRDGSLDWQTIELGAVTTPLAGSSELTFGIGEDVISFVIVLIDDDGLRTAVDSLVAPDGTVLIDINDGTPDINPGFNWPSISSTILPSTDDPRAAPQAGTYRLRVGTYDPADWVNLTPEAGQIERVFVIPERAGEEGGVLDVNLHFAPDVLTAMSTDLDHVAEHAYVVNLLAEVDRVYSDLANVRVGAVEYGEIAATHDTVDTSDEIRTIVSTFSTPGRRGASLNIFLVRDLTFTGGYSTGRPGPPGIFGSLGSGIVAEAFPTGASTGTVLAHETGHYLGLYHTTEENGAVDPVSDTPECPTDTMSADSPSCPDYTNLMFPFFPLGTGLGLSPGQRRILRGNPILYEIARPTTCGPALPAYDVTDGGFATGNTGQLRDSVAGSCGGDGSPERLHVYRLDHALAGELEIRARGLDFAPVVHVRYGDCGDAMAEHACDSGDVDTDVVVRLDQPGRGAWFIAVDGRDGDGGSFRLDVQQLPP